MATVTVNPLASVGPTSIAYPTFCFDPDQDPSTPAPSIYFTQPTTGVTGIADAGTAGVNGLPPGISATFVLLDPVTLAGEIRFSGIPTAPTVGPLEYSIPLTSGTCINGLEASGTIDITPQYELSAVTSTSATSIGGSATVTIYGDANMLLEGETYELEYRYKQGDGSFTIALPASVTIRNGKGSFQIPNIQSTEDTYTVEILNIKKTSDVCTIDLSDSPPTTYFGVCSAVFTPNSGEFQTFFVPANVYSITIEVYGGGAGGSTNNSGGGRGGGGGAYSIRTDIPVTPGEPLGVMVGNGGGTDQNGGASYVTRDSNNPDQIGTSLIFANGGNTMGAGGTYDTRYSGENGGNRNGANGGDGGGPLGGAGGQNKTVARPAGGGGGSQAAGANGLIVISYSCPDADQTDCLTIIDDGSKSGYTVLEYTCDDTWVAPEGLAEFTVFVGSAGGGGGSGEGAGGGGSGALIVQTFSTTNPYGLPEGTPFYLEVGRGGPGADVGDQPGKDGEPSTFSGTIDGVSFDIFVPGGGGGGSQIFTPGAPGASGGGGGASRVPTPAKGDGGQAQPITNPSGGIVYNGNSGGNGDFEKDPNSNDNGDFSIAGGGGGGLVPFGNFDKPDGKAAGQGQGEGGDGGNGITLFLGDSIRYYGAGGGGIGEYFNGADKDGLGGLAGGIKLGGDGNLNPSSNSGRGFNGVDKTGSGGGAGYFGGGFGGDGVIYIVFANFSILKVEYLYFEA
ncbi:MAG: hypothetical protein HWD85_12245, partial [Flavobacteriaceae bacterium]|nr:hypothetical protein [Flavobacteriaceae bacterium]